MPLIKITTNFPEVQKWLDAAQKQATIAAAVALTKTAHDVRNELKSEMRRVFHAPTSYTLNSLYLKVATKNNLTAEVWLKDDSAGSGTPAARYLMPQIVGGGREQKGFEKALAAHGLLPSGMRAVPGSGVKLDSYGNFPRGTLTQILSQLRVQMTAGYESRASSSARSRRTVRKQGVVYFVLTKRHGRLLPGIYGRYSSPTGSTVKPIFIYVNATRYKSRLHFFRVAERVAKANFAGHFDRAYAWALRTAR